MRATPRMSSQGISHEYILIQIRFLTHQLTLFERFVQNVHIFQYWRSQI